MGSPVPNQLKKTAACHLSLPYAASRYLFTRYCVKTLSEHRILCWAEQEHSCLDNQAVTQYMAFFLEKARS